MPIYSNLLGTKYKRTHFRMRNHKNNTTMRRLHVKIKKRKNLLDFSYIQGKPVKSLD